MSNSGSYSVSGINQAVRSSLEGNPSLQNIWVEGEVFNFNRHPSGHIYFSLKDDQSALRCTFFKGANARQKDLRLQNGMKILAAGGISVYAQRGDYQLNVQKVIPSGEGELRLRIERLKRKLQEEGLFEPSRKKDLPFLPVTLGVATAPRGAAIQDIIRVARSRFPGINILLAPCLVQGDGSIESVVEAIHSLQDPDLGVDVIIAGRGGGSFEDLLTFNEEPVVRAYAESRIPIISAVGHEIDHPLSDLAADRYAATPSAAAEMAIPVYADLQERLLDYEYRMRSSLRSRHRNDKNRLLSLMKSRVYEKPATMLESRYQELDYLSRDLKSRIYEILRMQTNRMASSASIAVLYDRNLGRFRNRFSSMAERLQAYGPLATLKRGFSLTRNEKKELIRSVEGIEPGDALEVILERGALDVRVEQVRKKSDLES